MHCNVITAIVPETNKRATPTLATHRERMLTSGKETSILVNAITNGID